ncbi:uncharacterized protein LOC111051460 isoform X3 [Nilaparvata lugens]|uniref:uncharacterized protein LOC111051460 isoform X2 n=1 Tax=Nilaparvata lugens TaxID=108931 RepID=UPI00193D5CC1|nr:uncharacterized protein LOC111051460 isoform X2 [Nilaparvata lugens]XP_039278998.1 uncharacterized protein LOC111051460 isoform X3 [Nilaparvata lugens]
MEAKRAEKREDQDASFPEYTQVKARLLQIQDYIVQTTGVMEQLKAAGTPQHMEKWLKLADMLEGLRDSEVKLTAILKTLDQFEDDKKPDAAMEQAEQVNTVKETQPDQAQPVSSGDSRSCLNEISKLQTRLRELQLKKAQMDQIVDQFSSLEKSIDRDEEQSNDDSMDGEKSAARVEGKMAELALLKTQLGQMQSLICGLGQNSSQSINIEEEKEEESSPEGNLNQEQSNGYADDESLQRLKLKSMALSDAKAKLSRMKQLLTLVEDIRSLGKPVPTRVLALLNSDEGPLNNSEASFMDMSDQSLQEICNELAATVDCEKQGQKNKVSAVDDSSPKRHKSGEE